MIYGGFLHGKKMCIYGILWSSAGMDDKKVNKGISYLPSHLQILHSFPLNDNLMGVERKSEWYCEL